MCWEPWTGGQAWVVVPAMALLCDLSPVPAPLWAFASLSTKEGDWLSYENSL